MDAFSVASQILGGLELSPGQLAQLRAINHKYFQQLFTLLRGPQRPDVASEGYSGRGSPGAERELTQEEITVLRAMLVTDVRGMLSPEQRRLLDHE